MTASGLIALRPLTLPVPAPRRAAGPGDTLGDVLPGFTATVPLTRFVGRAGEVAALTDQVGRSRLVTLIGPGGSGKTRLARAVCERSAGSLAADVCWVELAELDDPALVVQAVSAAAGLTEAPGSPLMQTLAVHLRRRPTLLVLDNCEHLVDAVAVLAGQLLRACPALRIVATSRESLAVTGETTWAVDGLSVPAGAGAPTAAELSGSEAVQLFVDRARLVQPGFVLTDDNAAAVARLCRRLDGQPLALELAAARLRVLPLQQVVDRLDDAFSVLVTNARDAAPRHQTLRATLDWSHALLPEPERCVFAALSVFRGGFTLEAAETVVRVVAAGGVLQVLGRLVEKSLVQVHGDGERYRLLEVVRQYAEERLGPHRDAVAARHVAYYLSVAEDAEPHLTAGGQKLWLDRLHRDHDNLRAALAWSWQHDPTLGIRLAGALGRYCYLRGHYAEGREWLQAAVAAGTADTPPAAHAKALVRLAMLEFLQADYAGAAARLASALKLYDREREPRAVAEALQVLGSIAREQADYAAARARYEDSLALWRQLDEHAGAARALNSLAFVAWLQDDQERAGQLAAEALRSYRDIGDGKGVAWALIHLGVSAHHRGDVARARPLLTESLTLSRELGFREGAAWSLEQLGLLAAADGAPGEAVALLRQSLAMHNELGDRWRIASVLEGLAHELIHGCDGRAAARLMAAAAELRAAIGTPVPPCDRHRHEARCRAVAAAVTPQELAAATAEGQAMSADHAVSAALAAADSFTPAPAPTPPPSGTAPPERPSGTVGSPRPSDATALQVYALGRTEVLAGGRLLGTEDWTYAKPRELLYYLLENPRSSKADIGLALWPDASPGELRNSFHTCLKHLRRAVGDPGRVRFSGQTYYIEDAGELRYDVAEFRAAARAALAVEPTPAALPMLVEAAGRYPGDFLVDLAVSDWADAIRQPLRRDYERVMLVLGSVQAKDRRYAAAAETFTRLTEYDPLLEAAHRGVMRCHAALGNRARAVRQYQQLVALLDAETGAPPAPETTALYERLRQQPT